MDDEQRARIEKQVISTWPFVTVDRGDLLALLAAHDAAVAQITWCPRGEGEHLLDDVFNGWCSTCGATVTGGGDDER